MLGDLSSFVIGAAVFIVDAFILSFLVASALGQARESKIQDRGGFAVLMVGMLAVCKTFFLLSSLFICFRLVKVSPLPFVMGSSLSLIAFVGFMYVMQQRQGLSSKN